MTDGAGTGVRGEVATPVTTPLQIPGDVPAEEAEELRAAHRLVATTRRLMQAVATTDVGVQGMHEAERTLAGLADGLGERRRSRYRRIPFDTDSIARVQAGQPWEQFPFNPLGIPLVVHVRGARAHASLDVTALHAGPPDFMHGGFGAALMDALLSSLVQAQGLKAVTASLEVRFVRAIPLDVTVALGGEVVRTEGRKTWAEGWIEHEGVRCLETRGLFIQVAGEPD